MRYQFTPRIIIRFWSKVDRSGGPDACWPWMAGMDKDGYGKFSYPGNRYARAHRVSWSIANGPIEDGLYVCHTCDNPSCVNPSHLFIGTNTDNMRDKVKKGRHNYNAAWNPIGSKNPRAKLSDAQVIEARRRWLQGGISKSQLAREMGVSSTLMSWVITGKVWRHLPSVEDLSGHD